MWRTTASLPPHPHWRGRAQRSGGDCGPGCGHEKPVRLVKGAYLEPPDAAYPRKVDVDRNYIRLAERALVTDGYTAIATHDDRIIDYVIDFTSRRSIPAHRVEFQMLYGVRPLLQLELVSHGHRVRVATPHGPEWYPYLMRRLAERPANVLFLLRNLLRR
jgi:proline dehydrogenase